MEVILIQLLDYLRGNNLNHTYEIIANILIEHINEIKDYSLTDFCTLCNCSESTFSRFLKALGFNNYRNFSMLLAQPQLVYHHTKDTEYYYDTVIENLAMIHNLVKSESFQYMIEDLQSCKEILIVSFPTNLSYTMDFQCKMILAGKKVRVISSFELDTLKEIDSNTFVMVVTFKGNFNHVSFIHSLSHITSALITLNDQISYQSEFDYTFIIGRNKEYGQEVYPFIYLLDAIYQSVRN